MTFFGIREEDIAEKFIRSSGKGGQHVNKTSTCVWLKHLPTGIEVKCMEERSQSLNRLLARRELVERVEAPFRDSDEASSEGRAGQEAEGEAQEQSLDKYDKTQEDKRE